MATPIAIGTRGTVGYLVKKEIEFFNNFDLDGYKSSRKSQAVQLTACSLWFSTMSWRKNKKKKRTGSSGFLPSICSDAKIAGSDQSSLTPGFRYKILKDVNT
ncbi:hypothetical protein ACFE04_000979 [Oxalis oulophora]